MESQADWIWVNEGNPELNWILQQNLVGAIADISPVRLILHRERLKPMPIFTLVSLSP
ncbi:hypothetical protein [Coleofasciculus sp. F4-SAH-05]|uniref:hypothetical protein n=1 Tax=Coleofasciculus sp. F4-SAH-05 TaxID=3069525 RepID=UPI0032FEBDFA